MGTPGDGTWGLIPDYSCSEAGDGESQLLECVDEEEVVFVTIASSPMLYQFLVQRIDIEFDGDAEQRVEVFEGDGGGMEVLDLVEGIQCGCPGAVVSYFIQIGVEVRLAGMLIR